MDFLLSVCDCDKCTERRILSRRIQSLYEESYDFRADDYFPSPGYFLMCLEENRVGWEVRREIQRRYQSCVYIHTVAQLKQVMHCELMR